jgi:hypothetical protein
MRKVVYLFFLKKYDKGDHRTMINAWGAMILDRCTLHQSWTAEFSQDPCASGATIIKQGKSEIHECSRRESSRR